MKTVKMTLAKTQRLIGHCQLTYTSKNDEGQKLVYCLQDTGTAVRLLRCTQDGEASHEVRFTQVRAEFERPVPADNDSEYTIELKSKCTAWIDAYEKAAV